MRLLQLKDSGGRFVAVRDDDGHLRRLRGAESIYALAQQAAAEGTSLRALAEQSVGDAVDEAQFFPDNGSGGVLPPIDCPDPAHLMVSGTGLTHLGSAKTRDSMHTGGEKEDAAPQTDSMRMFQLGVQGGKPPADVFFGAQPEWFYKGDGSTIVPSGAALSRPAFATDGGEEPEIAGVYVIDEHGVPCRLGFALGNEFSDHIMEKQNYLYLAHSKLRQCALGAELLLGELPAKITGTSAIRRRGEVVWEQEFLSGEDHMCHSIANLERHHFKYAQFCRPGSVHVHFFGTATLSFAAGVTVEDGDEFVISCPAFGQPLVNRVQFAADTARAREGRVL